MINSIEIFKALGEETRLRIMRIMIKADVELCACEIIDVLEKPQYTISKNLGILVSAGLITERREGRMMHYALVRNSFTLPIYQSIKELSCGCSPAFTNDFKKLSKRLSARKNGQCAEGCGK